jgi:hypothetical protein
MNILWNKEKGYLKYGIYKYKVYKPDYAVRKTIVGYCNLMIKRPDIWHKLLDAENKSHSMNATIAYIVSNLAKKYLDRAYPLFMPEQKNKIIKNLKDFSSLLIGIVIEYKDIYGARGIKSNIMFIASISMQRDWGDTCFMCLDENIHDKAVIYKPCGHALCLECDDELSKKSIDKDDRDDKNIISKCSICQTPIIEKIIVSDEKFTYNFIKGFL